MVYLSGLGSVALYSTCHLGSSCEASPSQPSVALRVCSTRWPCAPSYCSSAMIAVGTLMGGTDPQADMVSRTGCEYSKVAAIQGMTPWSRYSFSGALVPAKSTAA